MGVIKIKFYGKKLKELRIEHGLTQEEFGKKIGKSKTGVSLYENGTRKPDIDTIINTSNIFNCSADYLLGLKNDSEIYEFTDAEKELIELLKDIKNMGFSINEIKRIFEGSINEDITDILKDNTDLIEIVEIIKKGNVKYKEAKEIADILGYEIKWIKKEK